MKLIESLPSLFRLAKLISKQSDYKIKMGCVLVDHGTPISVGYNQIKSNPKFSYEFGLTIHAEASCIMSVRYKNLKGMEIFIYRETKTKKPALAKPCDNCLSLLREYHIKRIWYTVNTYPYFNVERI